VIQLPTRSVTRFFIPLIDVLILLFCIYLLLPIVKGPDDTSAEGAMKPLDEKERQELEELRRTARDSRRLTVTDRQELERLRRQNQEPLEQRLAIRVLEIDPDSGKLFYYDPERTEIPSEAKARALVVRQRREAAGRELYYLFLFPRKLTGYPEERQVEQYKRWFAGVPNGFDNPQAGP